MDIGSIVQDNIASLRYFVPELVLTGVVLLLIIADLILGRKRSAWLSFITLGGLAVTFYFVLQQYDLGNRHLFGNMLAVDPFAIYFKILFLASGTMVIFLSIGSIELAGRPVGEYFTLIVALILGMFLMASATNLLTIFISIELVSVISFVLATYLKTRRRSSEAGLKYAIYGAFSSGLMLYGLSLLFGLTGTLNIYEIREALASAEAPRLTMIVSTILILGGFGYKIASVPFHFWSPDVYEGAPTPITALLSVGPKAAGFAVLIRFFNVTLASSGTNGQNEAWSALLNINWPMVLAIVSAATMTLGNLVAIVQNNVKRLLAYSSIAHAGYALMGTVLLTSDGVHATLYYLFVYYLMNLGAFLVVIVFQDLVKSEDIESYKGLGWKAPVPAIAMGVFLFSLTGLPPTAGFIGKFYLFAAIIKSNSQFYWLAIVAIANSVISLYYYARILKAMFFDKSTDTSTIAVSPYYTVLLGVLAVPLIFLGIYWGPLDQLATFSVEFLRTL